MSDIALESLDLITIVVPPALPAAMTVGRFYAQNRLQAKNVYCISPRTINVSGSIDCVCFDKVSKLFINLVYFVPGMNVSLSLASEGMIGGFSSMPTGSCDVKEICNREAFAEF